MNPRSLLVAALLPLCLAQASRAQEALPGYRFFPTRSTLYAPARRLTAELGLQAEIKGGSLYVGDEKIPQSAQESLPDGTSLVQLRALPGATVVWNQERAAAEVHLNDKTAYVDDRNCVTDAVTFASRPSARIYAPLSEIAAALKQPLAGRRGSPTLGDQPVSDEGLRTLLDGTRLLDVERLKDWKAGVTTEDGSAQVEFETRHLWVRKAQQRVAISIRHQRMRAWQGRRLILDTKVSTGRAGHATPPGLYTAGPLKSPLVISHKYNDAKMPWAVQDPSRRPDPHRVRMADGVARGHASLAGIPLVIVLVLSWRDREGFRIEIGWMIRPVTWTTGQMGPRPSSIFRGQMGS
jgi:hypothetical protein